MRRIGFAIAAGLLGVSHSAFAQDAADVEIARTADGHPDFNGFWSLTFDPVNPELVAKLADLPPNTVVITDTGVAEYPRGEFGDLVLTEAAKEHAEEWRPEDEMQLNRVCLPPSVVYSIQGPFPFEIFQTPELIVFKYEYYDMVRLIHMDGRGHPGPDYPHSKAGHSIGHWEGDELVIDTTHIAASTITNNGLDHTDDVHMVEHYRISDDGQHLVASQWFSDPAMLENNGARYIEWYKREGEHVYPYECDPSFALEYQTMTAEDGQ